MTCARRMRQHPPRRLAPAPGRMSTKELNTPLIVLIMMMTPVMTMIKKLKLMKSIE